MANEHTEFLNSLLNVQQSVVNIPPGEYQVDSPIVLRYDNQWIDARGVDISPASDFTGDTLLRASGTQADRLKNVRIEGVKINCKNTAVVGIKAEWNSYLVLEKCVVLNSKVQAAILREGWDTHLVRCQFFKSGSKEPSLACLELSADPINAVTGTRTISLDGVTVGDYPGVGILAVNQYSLMASQTKIHHQHGATPQQNGSDMGLRCENCIGVRFNGLIVARRYRAWECIGCHDYEINVIDTSRQ